MFYTLYIVCVSFKSTELFTFSNFSFQFKLVLQHSIYAPWECNPKQNAHMRIHKQPVQQHIQYFGNHMLYSNCHIGQFNLLQNSHMDDYVSFITSSYTFVRMWLDIDVVGSALYSSLSKSCLNRAMSCNLKRHNTLLITHNTS